jgi:hypothetical protein
MVGSFVGRREGAKGGRRRRGKPATKEFRAAPVPC